MEYSNHKLEDYYETLVQNLQKGEIYSIKFRGDPEIYTGIPMIPFSFNNESDSIFIFKIISPEHSKGVHEKLVKDIELLEKEIQ